MTFIQVKVIPLALLRRMSQGFAAYPADGLHKLQICRVGDAPRRPVIDSEHT